MQEVRTLGESTTNYSNGNIIHLMPNMILVLPTYPYASVPPPPPFANWHTSSRVKYKTSWTRLKWGFLLLPFRILTLVSSGLDE